MRVLGLGYYNCNREPQQTVLVIFRPPHYRFREASRFRVLGIRLRENCPLEPHKLDPKVNDICVC